MSRARAGLICLVAVLVACTADVLEPNTRPASPARSIVTLSRATVLSGAAVQVKLETRDAEGKPLTSGGAAVAFEVSGGTSTGTLSPVTDQGDGTYTALFTGIAAGTPATVGATIDGSPVTRPLPTIQVLPGPISPDVSIVRVTPATITVGAAATLELVTRDAQGNDLTTGGRQVVFILAGGTSAGTVGPVTDHDNGHYTAVFTATSRGTPLTVSATVNGTPVSAALPTLTVAAGVSPDSSIMEVSSDSVAIGDGVTLTLRVVDSTGIDRTSGGEIVVFSLLTGPGTSQGSVDSTTDHDDGTYTAIFTASNAGSPLGIVATIGGRPVADQPTITVRPDPISPQHSSVMVSADTVASGSAAVLTLVVRRLDNSPVTTGGLSVVFTATDGLSTGVIGAATDHGDGSYSAGFTGVLAGTATTIGATINDSSVVQMLDSSGVSQLPTVTVVAGPQSVDSSLFTVTPSILTLGDSAMLQLEVRDAAGNPVGQGGRNVSFARVGGPGASVGTITTITDGGDGTYSAYYRADSAGTADTLTATLDGVLLPSRAAILVSCIAGPVSVTASDLTVNDTTLTPLPRKSVTLPSGVSTTVILRVRDGVGCPITTPHAVVIAIGAGTSTGLLGPVTDQQDGSYAATFTGVLAGAPTTLAATIDGSAVLSAPATVTVIPGDISPQTSIIVVAPAQVDSGAHATATLIARDAAGNGLVGGGRLVTLNLPGANSHGSLSPTADLGNGSYSALYTGTVVAPGSPDLVGGIIEGTPVSTPSPGIEVVAGTISPDQSLVSASAATLAVGDSLLVTLVGKDASGRSLVTGDRSDPIAFSLTGGTSLGTFGPVQNQGDGSYTAWLLGVQAGTASTIGTTIDGNSVTTSLPSVVVTP